MRTKEEIEQKIEELKANMNYDSICTMLRVLFWVKDPTVPWVPEDDYYDREYGE